MRIEKRCPGAAATAHAGRVSRRHNSTRRFPRCELHDRAIVDQLPPGCPLSAEWPIDAVGAYRRRGWRNLGEWIELDAASDDLARADVCSKCIADNLRHPRVKRLRRQLGVAHDG